MVWPDRAVFKGGRIGDCAWFTSANGSVFHKKFPTILKPWSLNKTCMMVQSTYLIVVVYVVPREQIVVLVWRFGACTFPTPADIGSCYGRRIL